MTQGISKSEVWGWEAAAKEFGDTDERDHKIRFVLDNIRNKKVLDIGCVHHNPEKYKSKYWVHKAIVKYASSVKGIDILENGVEYLKERGFDIEVGDACGFNLNNKYEVIVACDLIEHISNAGSFLECCASHLVVGGKLLISTPNPWFWKNVARAAMLEEVSNNPEHTCWYDVVTLRQLASRYNFDLLHVTYGSRFISDKCMPLPTKLRNTSIHTVFELRDNGV